MRCDTSGKTILSTVRKNSCQSKKDRLICNRANTYNTTRCNTIHLRIKITFNNWMLKRFRLISNIFNTSNKVLEKFKAVKDTAIF